jgi:hypothetical protein
MEGIEFTLRVSWDICEFCISAFYCWVYNVGKKSFSGINEGWLLTAILKQMILLIYIQQNYINQQRK